MALKLLVTILKISLPLETAKRRYLVVLVLIVNE